MAEIKSEHTKDMTAEEREELRKFRNSMDADGMGFFGEESV